MLKKIITLISLSLFLNASMAAAQVETSTVGNFTIMEKGGLAPFDGVLLDPTATAIILTDKEQMEKEFQLKLNFELDKQKTNFNFQLESVKLSLEMCDRLRVDQLTAKDKELTEIRKLAMEKSDNAWLYIGGGVIGGIIITLITVWAETRIRN
jgi:hypothetical protein